MSRAGEHESARWLRAVAMRNVETGARSSPRLSTKMSVIGSDASSLSSSLAQAGAGKPPTVQVKLLFQRGAVAETIGREIRDR